MYAFLAGSGLLVNPQLVHQMNLIIQVSSYLNQDYRTSYGQLLISNEVLLCACISTDIQDHSFLISSTIVRTVNFMIQSEPPPPHQVQTVGT